MTDIDRLQHLAADGDLEAARALLPVLLRRDDHDNARKVARILLNAGEPHEWETTSGKHPSEQPGEHLPVIL